MQVMDGYIPFDGASTWELLALDAVLSYPLLVHSLVY